MEGAAPVRTAQERADDQERMRLGILVKRGRKTRAQQPRSARMSSEDIRFNNRLRFGRSKFWRPNVEPKSLPPPTWPMFEEAVRKYGIESLPRAIGVAE
jgi:hypothetical protein